MCMCVYKSLCTFFLFNRVNHNHHVTAPPSAFPCADLCGVWGGKYKETETAAWPGFDLICLAHPSLAFLLRLRVIWQDYI
jgi:hypothetical protein